MCHYSMPSTKLLFFLSLLLHTYTLSTFRLKPKLAATTIVLGILLMLPQSFSLYSMATATIHLFPSRSPPTFLPLVMLNVAPSLGPLLLKLYKSINFYLRLTMRRPSAVITNERTSERA